MLKSFERESKFEYKRLGWKKLFLCHNRFDFFQRYFRGSADVFNFGQDGNNSHKGVGRVPCRREN